MHSIPMLHLLRNLYFPFHHYLVPNCHLPFHSLLVPVCGESHFFFLTFLPLPLCLIGVRTGSYWKMKVFCSWPVSSLIWVRINNSKKTWCCANSPRHSQLSICSLGREHAYWQQKLRKFHLLHFEVKNEYTETEGFIKSQTFPMFRKIAWKW